MLNYFKPNYNSKLIITVLYLFAISTSAVVYDYKAGINDCERQAKLEQYEHRGDLVFLQFLQENGARQITGEYQGHFLNSKIINGRRYYWEYSLLDNQYTIMNSKEAVYDWFFNKTGIKTELYIIGVDSNRPNIKWLFDEKYPFKPSN